LELQKSIISVIELDFSSYFSLGDLRRKAKKRVIDALGKLSNPVLQVNFKELLKDDSKDNFNLLTKMYKYFLGVKFDRKKCL